MTTNPTWADHTDLVPYYSSHRNKPEDLYPSERRFLPWLALRSRSILDVGCAAGGFRTIWQAYRASLIYTGVDVSVELIRAAKQLHPDSPFIKGNCTDGIPLPDGYADTVQALGWLHWEPDYVTALRELWRLTGRFLFFDIRLVDSPDREMVGRQKLALSGHWDGSTTVPYVLVSWPSLAALLQTLRPSTILGYGYWGRPSESVMDISQEVCFATFVCERPLEQRAPASPVVCLDMPLDGTSTYFQDATILPSSELDGLLQP
jgi:SAM-dependent methyltransferase